MLHNLLEFFRTKTKDDFTNQSIRDTSLRKKPMIFRQDYLELKELIDNMFQNMNVAWNRSLLSNWLRYSSFHRRCNPCDEDYEDIADGGKISKVFY